MNYNFIMNTAKDADGNEIEITAKMNKDGTGLTHEVEVAGNLLQEQKTQADAVDNVITFSENITAIEIFHAEDTWQQFVVNGITLNIPAGGYRTPIAGVAGTTVVIPNIKCIVGRLV